jgi:hypothetical protein
LRLAGHCCCGVRRPFLPLCRRRRRHRYYQIYDSDIKAGTRQPPVVVVANKLDLVETDPSRREVSSEEGRRLAEQE